MGALPVNGSISQAYGVKNSRYAAGYHTGLDISAAHGTPIRSPFAGKVIYVGYYGSYGNTVKVKHADGSVGLYAHMSGFNVRMGQSVGAGQQIGRVGSTGQSTGNHLHWEIRRPGDKYGSQYSPLQYLNNNRSSGGSSRSSGGGRIPAKNSYSLAELKGIAMAAGFNSQQAAVMAAIAMGESSGRPSAHNPNASTGDNSYGLWQINMLGAMGPERRRLFGISSNNQLFDPLTNAKAAYKIYKMQGFNAWSIYKNGSYRKWLGAAQGTKAASFSSVGYSMGGDIGRVGAAGTGGGVDFFDAQIKRASPRELATNAGFVIAFWKSDPELWRIFKKWRNGRPTDTLGLESALRQSKWWKKHSESQRQMEMLKASDPAEYKARVQSLFKQIQDIDGSLGTGLSQKEERAIAALALTNGWSEAQIRDHLIKKSDIDKQLRQGKEVGGEAGELQDAFLRIAAEYGQSPNDATVRSQVMAVLRGNGTAEDFKKWAQTRAKQQYRHLADDFDRGFTLVDIARPYLETASRLLEKNMDEIDLQNSLVRKGLQGDGRTTMDLSDFERTIRQSDDWQYTDNARETYMAFGNDILNKFGFRG